MKIFSDLEPVVIIPTFILLDVKGKNNGTPDFVKISATK